MVADRQFICPSAYILIEHRPPFYFAVCVQNFWTRTSEKTWTPTVKKFWTWTARKFGRGRPEEVVVSVHLDFLFPKLSAAIGRPCSNKMDADGHFKSPIPLMERSTFRHHPVVLVLLTLLVGFLHRSTTGWRNTSIWYFPDETSPGLSQWWNTKMASIW